MTGDETVPFGTPDCTIAVGSIIDRVHRGLPPFGPLEALSGPGVCMDGARYRVVFGDRHASDHADACIEHTATIRAMASRGQLDVVSVATLRPSSWAGAGHDR